MKQYLVPTRRIGWRSGSWANIGDRAKLIVDGREQEGVVVKVHWLQMVFGQLLNCGMLTIQLPNGEKMKCNVAEVKVWQEFWKYELAHLTWRKFARKYPKEAQAFLKKKTRKRL